MTLNEFNAFCILLPRVSGSVRGRRHQWKAGRTQGRVFAVAVAGTPVEGGEPGAGRVLEVLFRASVVAWDVLRDVQGVKPHSRRAPVGQVWVACRQGGISDRELMGYLEASHALALASLSRKSRKPAGP